MDRYTVINLSADIKVYWNMLGADVMEIVFSRAIGEIQKTWELEGLFTGRYSDVYTRIAAIFQKSLVRIFLIFSMTLPTLIRFRGTC